MCETTVLSRTLLQLRQQQDHNVVAQLQSVIADKEAKVKQLEEEIKQTRLNVSGTLRKSVLQCLGALVTPAQAHRERPRFEFHHDQQQAIPAIVFKDAKIVERAAV